MPPTPEQMKALEESAARRRDRWDNPSCGGLFVEGVRIWCDPHYDEHPSKEADEETQKRYKLEEDEWAARETLGRLVVHHWPDVPAEWIGLFGSWQAYLMFLHKKIAKHYEVSADAVLSSFLKHYMPSLLGTLRGVTPKA